MTVLLKVSKAIDRFTGGIGRLVGWMTLAMLLIGAYNALARYADARQWTRQWLDAQLSSNAFIELQWYLFSLVFLLGSAYGLRQGAHVRVDVLYGRCSPRAKAWINVAGAVLFLLPFSVLVLWMSWPAVASSWEVREVSPDPGGLPRYPIKAVIPLAFLLLIVQALSELIKQVAFLAGVERDDGEHGAPAAGEGAP